MERKNSLRKNRRERNSVRKELNTGSDVIEIKNADIADVMKLKYKANNETSFCVSLNSEEAKCVVFDPNKWPIGVRIRTFYRATLTTTEKLKHAHQYKTDLQHTETVRHKTETEIDTTRREGMGLQDFTTIIGLYPGQ